MGHGTVGRPTVQTALSAAAAAAGTTITVASTAGLANGQATVADRLVPGREGRRVRPKTCMQPFLSRLVAAERRSKGRHRRMHRHPG
jgi:hypothetical protein